jgi:GxxExxY protein
MDERDPLTGAVIGAAIEVHRVLGPGFLESVYERCLCRELELRGVPYRRQVGLPVVYKGEALGSEFVMDVLVEERLLLELKTVEKLEPIHQAQLLTYMKLGRIHLGLLINFNVKVLRDGIKRMIL